jgi:(1->4)-alpha-D-glucan 1-alpha-D-glucosylmutase
MRTSWPILIDPASELSECFEHLASAKRDLSPLSTYRLQFNKNFHFEDARHLAPYLSRLGVSHCYASPLLKARAGSEHGYDIIDHNQLNPEIGREEEFRNFVSELKTCGMGLILDIVPNHMGVGYGSNPWWQDVLQSGRASAYADFFDIDWEPLKPELRNKVLTPILGSPYGEALEQGKIQVAWAEGCFVVKYSAHALPVDPQTIPLIFESAQDQDPPNHNGDAWPTELSSLLEAFRQLPANHVTDSERIARRQGQIPPLLERLRKLVQDSGIIRSTISGALRLLNGTPANSQSFDALHQLLEAQVYRLAFWRVSGEEINYRRFFDINDLVGLRMENPRVFAETHKLIRKLMAEGLISGLRVDHPYGLLNPIQYFARLQMLYAASQCLGNDPQSALAEDGVEATIHSAFRQQDWMNQHAPLYVLVEKILEPGENLPNDWPVDGTVGYDFTNLVNGILIDHGNERHFTNLYHRVIGGNVVVEQLVYDSKKLIMHRALASEVHVLTDLLSEISGQDRRARDFTHSVLRDAIRETIACFPVYRTYVDERGNVNERDRRYIQQAIARAKRRNETMAPAAFDFLQSILLLKGSGGGTTMYGYSKPLYFTLKFQQLTGPVMAKALEDTACYVYTRFVSVNEVGGSPGKLGIPMAEFHHGNQLRAEYWPNSMLGTSTHDSKRSEDVRARLDVLSEMPRTWVTQVMKWRRINRNRKLAMPDERTVPDNNEEYFLYQTLVGAWPLRMEGEEERLTLVRRIQQYMEKAVHEAKINVSWLSPNPEYVAGIRSFVETILSPTYRGRTNLYWDSMRKFLPAVQYFGVINSLTQTLLKLTSPGVPDIYQGQELWDFSLVDPDNRRPVDFDLRQRALEQLTGHTQPGDLLGLCQQLLDTYHDGRIKFWVTMQALNFRREHPALFRTGKYVPLYANRGKEDHVVAFARVRQEEAAIVAAPRLSYTLMKGNAEPPLAAAWGDSELVMPPELRGERWHNIFTGEVLMAAQRAPLCREIFAHFPVALFIVR